MGKTDLGAVDGAVARRLDEGEEVMVSGIDDDLLEDGLRGGEGNVTVSQLGLIFSVQDANSSSRLQWSGARTLSDSIVEAIVAVVLCCAWFWRKRIKTRGMSISSLQAQTNGRASA